MVETKQFCLQNSSMMQWRGVACHQGSRWVTKNSPNTSTGGSIVNCTINIEFWTDLVEEVASRPEASCEEALWWIWQRNEWIQWLRGKWYWDKWSGRVVKKVMVASEPNMPKYKRSEDGKVGANIRITCGGHWLRIQLRWCWRDYWAGEVEIL